MCFEKEGPQINIKKNNMKTHIYSYPILFATFVAFKEKRSGNGPHHFQKKPLGV